MNCCCCCRCAGRGCPVRCGCVQCLQPTHPAAHAAPASLLPRCFRAASARRWARCRCRCCAAWARSIWTCRQAGHALGWGFLSSPGLFPGAVTRGVPFCSLTARPACKPIASTRPDPINTPASRPPPPPSRRACCCRSPPTGAPCTRWCAPGPSGSAATTCRQARWGAACGGGCWWLGRPPAAAWRRWCCAAGRTCGPAASPLCTAPAAPLPRLPHLLCALCRRATLPQFKSVLDAAWNSCVDASEPPLPVFFCLLLLRAL